MDMTDRQHLGAPLAPLRTDAAWLDAHWMPYTGNRQFKAQPRMITAAQGAYLIDGDGRRIFDGLSGLWTCGLGHCQPSISRAVAQQVATLDYSPAFQFAHPLSFDLANRVVERMPKGLSHVFFTGSGSESADTSLKMARAYWRAKGQASKTRLIGRIKGYHGVNFGGISVGGIVANRKLFGQAVEADHLPHTQPPNGSFYQGMPPEAGGPGYAGAKLADELFNLINLHDASNIAAVIVEPMAGSAGVIIPASWPPSRSSVSKSAGNDGHNSTHARHSRQTSNTRLISRRVSASSRYAGCCGSYVVVIAGAQWSFRRYPRRSS